jgi:hypothetical protein
MTQVCKATAKDISALLPLVAAYWEFEAISGRVAEAEFKRLGLMNVSLQLSRGNDDARRFYHRHGYEERSGYELLDKNLNAV